MQETDAHKLKIEELIENDGFYAGPTVGISMLPMLKTGRDTIVVRKKIGRLSPLDVALYKRGDAYVLHRVIAVKEGYYRIRGDNCYSDELIQEEQVIGVLTEFFRKNKHYLREDKSYLRYAKRRIKNYPARRLFFQIKGKLKRIIKKILGITSKKKA